MANILIDPVIVISPSNNASKDDVETWLNNLDLWLTEALTSPFTWLYAKEAVEELLYSDHFPSPEVLFRWQRKYRLDKNIALINAKIGIFFNSEEYNNHFDFHLEKMGYLVITRPDSVVIMPNQFVARWPDAIMNHMYELLATTCACKHNNELFAQKTRIATLKIDDVTEEIQVSTIIMEALPDFIRPVDNKINQMFPLVFTPEDLLPLFNVVECWDKGELGVKYAVKQQYKNDWQNVAAETLPYEFGAYFIDSMMSRKDITDLILHKIIRTIAGIIANKPDALQHKPHWYRERNESHTSQLVRESDKATAWRITITHDGAGWRMHYWLKVDSTGKVAIEFSNILTKKDSPVIYY
jgi:hypothetical protein